MKYFVAIGGKEVVVEVAGDHLTVDGRRGPARRISRYAPRHPIRHLVVDGVSHAGGRECGAGVLGGAYGERHEAEAVDERTNTSGR